MTTVRSDYCWMNGRLVPWADSTLHICSEAVWRGASVFEGIAAYRGGDGLALFRVGDHLHRLFATSMRFMRMRIEYDATDLTRAIAELLQANGATGDVHIRLTAYFDDFRPGHELEAGTGVFIVVRPRLAPETPLRVTLSPWRRLGDLTLPPRVKMSANYMNSRIATVDAQSKGFDSAILLNERGKVSEGPAMNVFMVRGGVLSTPRVTDGILEGITRDTVIDIARRHSLPTEVREIDATELYLADEIFFCGTAYEVTPVVALDGYVVGDGGPGPITQAVRQTYFDLVRGEAHAPDGWLTSVDAAWRAADDASAR